MNSANNVTWLPSFDIRILNTLCQTMVYVAVTLNNQSSVWLKFHIFCNTLPSLNDVIYYV